MVAVSTGFNAPAGVSAGIGEPHAPVRVDQSMVAPNPMVSQSNVQQASQPNVAQHNSMPQQTVPFSLKLPELPTTSNAGTAEVAAVVKNGVLQYTRHWYGTEEERTHVHELLAEWAEENEVDALIFFVSTESFYRPKPKLQRMNAATEGDAQ